MTEEADPYVYIYEHILSDVDKEQMKKRLVKGPLPEGMRVFSVGELTFDQQIVYAIRKKQEHLEYLKGQEHGNDSDTEESGHSRESD